MKKVFFMLVAAFALVSFQKAQASETKATVTEQVTKESTKVDEAYPTPTGDADKDAKAVVDYVINKILACKTIDDLQNMETVLGDLEKTFDKYGKAHPDYEKEFENATKKHEERLQKTIAEVSQKIMQQFME